MFIKNANLKTLVLILLILTIGVVFRFYLLGDISTGLHADEASQGYNAFSLLKTGKDMFGKPFPVLFRANGSYQPPVYTYLSILPVFMFGNTIFAVKFVSAFAGSILILVTYLFIYKFGVGNQKQKILQGLFSALVIAISPWGIHFSRLAVEGNLVVPFFILAVFFLLLSLERKYYFILGCFILGLTTHIYYTERLTSLMFLMLFLLVYRKSFVSRKKEIFLGLLAMGLIMVPHLFLLKSGALTKRLDQVGYLKNIHILENESVVSKAKIVSGQFLDHYLYYFSPKNLFIDPGQNIGRTSYNLSVFYPWFLLPLAFGASYLIKKRNSNLVKALIIILIIGPIPAGLTGDLFFPLRVLSYLWAVTVVIAFGFYDIWIKLVKSSIRFILLIGVVTFSLFSFYISYFAVTKYESVNDFSYSYIMLMDQLNDFKDKKVLVDYSNRAWGAGIRMVYLNGTKPENIQKLLRDQLDTPYYSSTVNPYLTYIDNNVVVKAINWETDLCSGFRLFVGDKYSISEEQVANHNLKQEFSVNDINGNPTLFGYSKLDECNDKYN